MLPVEQLPRAANAPAVLIPAKAKVQPQADSPTAASATLEFLSPAANAHADRPLELRDEAKHGIEEENAELEELRDSA